MTVAEMVYDVQTYIYGGKPSDDIETNFRQILFWINTQRAKIIPAYLKKRNWDIPMSMIERIPCVLVTEDSDECATCVNHILSIDTPLDIPLDKGVYQVLRPDGSIVQRRRSAGEASIIKNKRFGSEESWYRAGNKIYLRGGKYISDLKMTVLLVRENPKDLSDGDEYPAPAEVNAAILDLAKQIGEKQVAKEYDINNDGKE